VTEFDGEYELRAIFGLCRANICAHREDRAKTIVEAKLSTRSRIDVSRVQSPVGHAAVIRILPIDE
jgi:hypothetical protein